MRRQASHPGYPELGFCNRDLRNEMKTFHYTNTIFDKINSFDFITWWQKWAKVTLLIT